MQKRPSVVYIRRRPCRRSSVRAWGIFILLLLLLLCFGVKPFWAAVLSGIFTGLIKWRARI